MKKEERERWKEKDLKSFTFNTFSYDLGKAQLSLVMKMKLSISSLEIDYENTDGFENLL